MRYLLDANVFIEAKNRYYAFDICPGFWDWMDHVTGAMVGTVVMVRQELTTTNDELADWIRARRHAPWFLEVDDEPTQRAFLGIAASIAAVNYTPRAQKAFLGCADPWLIAKAQVLGATLVAHETKADPSARKRVMIPNVCEPLNIPCINTFEALRLLAGSFSYHQSR